MKLFKVEISETVLVVAEDEGEAMMAARREMTEIKSDNEFVVGIPDELDKDCLSNELPDDWDVDCIPYGGDGNTRISDIDWGNQ